MTRVLVDARMALRGLGIATFLDRLLDGFAAHPSVSMTLWRGSGDSDRMGKLATLGRSGLFDLAPRLDPRAHGFAAIHFLSNVGSVFPGGNTVLTVHDLLHRRRLRRRDRLLGFLLEQSLGRAGRVVAVSGRTRDAIEQAFPRLRGRVEVIPHGMRRLPLPQGERRHLLAFGGASDPRKRTDLMVEAYREYRRTTSEALPLVVLARAGLSEGHVRELRCLDAELVTGADGAEVDRLVAGAAAILYPSTAEGFGLPILEAAEVGTRVVIDGCADVATEVLGAHCVRVTGDDVRDWADGIRTAVKEGPVADALRLPDWASVAGRYAELYREVAGA